MPPERLGPYRIVGTLGYGGMGAVYEGINEETGERAALKILAAALSKHENFRDRFKSEVDALRKLRHPNIVRLFGFGEQQGTLFYAMELVEGSSLEQEIQQGTIFGWKRVARIGVETCKALRHAHDRGVIHRDIKPANLLQGRDGRVKLSDFGIARLFGNTGLTGTGNVLGTVEYMAPEQANARSVDPRTDLYSLGGVMFALLAGRPPFRGATPLKVLEKQRSAPAEPVRRYAPGTPPEFEAMIAQLLEKDPDKRIANATLLQRRLEAMLHALADVPDSAELPADHTVADEDLAPGATPGSQEVSGLPAMPPTRPVGAGSVTPPHDAAPAEDELPETRVTSAFRAYARDDDGSGAPTRPADPVVSDEQQPGQATGEHFVSIAEDDLDRVEDAKEPHHALISLQTWLLAGCLIAAGATTWYLLQPPSADDLYGRIASATADGTLASYREAESDLARFLRLYPNDLRRPEVQAKLQEIELDRLEKRFVLQAKGWADTGKLLPVQRAYLEALRYAELDPDLGIPKLRALLRLYPDAMSGPTGDCLQLARRRLELLERQREQVSKVDAPWLQGRLDRADSNETDPDTARAIREAAIELYGDNPAMAEPVERARNALAEPEDG